MKQVKIYTDGACSGNPGPGGWAALLIYGAKIKEISGCKPDTTNNQMELMAAIKALESLKEKCEVELYTDSKYVLDGITSWIHGWKKNNWRNSKKEPVKNIDLWIELDAQVARHNVKWKWVKAHNGDEYNERADQLAVAASLGVKK